MEEMASCEICVRGLVQGVGYRYFTEDIAGELGIKGYSRNLPDGGVYLAVEGRREEVERFIGHLWKGPRLARVSDVKVTWKDYQGIFIDFSIKY